MVVDKMYTLNSVAVAMEVSNKYTSEAEEAEGKEKENKYLQLALTLDP